MAEATVEIKNKLGLHLRAASSVAETAARFNAAITLKRGKNQVNARSVTGLIMLGAGQGSRLKLRAEGPDAHEAVIALRAIFEDGFGEN